MNKSMFEYKKEQFKSFPRWVGVSLKILPPVVAIALLYFKIYWLAIILGAMFVYNIMGLLSRDKID